MKTKHFVYFLLSLKNNKVYVGRTDKDPKEREKEYNEGSNEWSKHNRPLKLIYHEAYHCKEDAVKRERFYKMGFGKSIKNL